MGARRLPPRLPLTASETEIERVGRIAHSRRAMARSRALADLRSLESTLSDAAGGKLTEEGLERLVLRLMVRFGLRSGFLDLARVRLSEEISRLESQLEEGSDD